MGILYVYGDRPSVSVGRDPESDIRLKDSFVSRRHLRFESVTDDVAVLYVLGVNGAVVEGVKVSKDEKCHVRAGDCISIGSYMIIWMGIREKTGRSFARYVQRPPDPEVSGVDIEDPPPRRVPEKPSVMLAAGPALTMALPILLGAGRNIAILTSVFAAGWAAVNVLGRIRKQKTEEKRRRNTYLSYLNECEAQIRIKQERTIRALFIRYPTVGEQLAGCRDPVLLWRPSEEKVKVRLGTGTVTNPLVINIQKERFTTVDDSLKELPRLIKKKYSMLRLAPVLIDPGGGVPVVFRIGNEEERQMLAAFILQIAVSYSPEILGITARLELKTMRYFMWMMFLPHFCVEAEEDTPKTQKLVVTDEMPYAYSAISREEMVILATYDEASLPAGLGFVNTRSGVGSGPVIDMIHPKLCFSYAAQLSRLAGPGRTGGTGLRVHGIPSSVPFGRLFGISLAENDMEEAVKAFSEVIKKRYEMNDITESFAAPVGTGEGEKAVVLDLHEKAHGPHGLIAGMTGSGKSELLTTMILSFASNYPPDKLAFLLIDYKGGGMSNLFEDLPHLLASISNLSGPQSQRVIMALKSENIRRQKMFADAGVNNINDYTKLYDQKGVDEPLPHILIVIDEFAELRKEEPDIMDRLISIAQVGRSLGMHLILSTQRPAGVVDDKIRSNTRFRIALRLADRADSMDMLQRCEAASLRECGRAYLQVGNDELFECFQSGYAMESIFSGMSSMHIYEDLVLKKEVFEDDAADVPEENATWYEMVLEALIRVCDQPGTKKIAPFYLPELPERVYDEKAYAVFDNLYMQKYEKAYYEPEKDGHVLICGRSGTGKSELLNTLITAFGGKCAVYIIDHGGGKLKSHKDRKYCGGYISEEAESDIPRMTGFIHEELLGRRKRGKGKIINEHTVILILDDLPAIKKTAYPPAFEHIRQILSLGAGARIYVIASCMSANETGCMKLFDTFLHLGNDDKYEVASFLRASPKDIPSVKECPGRGAGIRDGAVLEFQAVIREKIPRFDDVMQAPFYPHVSDEPTLEELLARAADHPPDMTRGESEVPAARLIPAGFELASGKLYFLPDDRVRCVLVGGKAGKGRHTFLFNISVAAAKHGVKCIRADTYDSLISACRLSNERTIITVDSMATVLGEFYKEKRSETEEDELASYVENQPAYMGDRKRQILIVGILENDAAAKFSGRKIYDAMIKNPYAVLFGGSFDEDRNFDLTYMSFSDMRKQKKRYVGTVIKHDEDLFCGDIIIPGRINVDNLQSQ